MSFHEDLGESITVDEAQAIFSRLETKTAKHAWFLIVDNDGDLCAIGMQSYRWDQDDKKWHVLNAPEYRLPFEMMSSDRWG